jgi:hypothetical protein
MHDSFALHARPCAAPNRPKPARLRSKHPQRVAGKVAEHGFESLKRWCAGVKLMCWRRLALAQRPSSARSARTLSPGATGFTHLVPTRTADSFLKNLSRFGFFLESEFLLKRHFRTRIWLQMRCVHAVAPGERVKLRLFARSRGERVARAGAPGEGKPATRGRSRRQYLPHPADSAGKNGRVRQFLPGIAARRRTKPLKFHHAEIGMALACNPVPRCVSRHPMGWKRSFWPAGRRPQIDPSRRM